MTQARISKMIAWIQVVIVVICVGASSPASNAGEADRKTFSSVERMATERLKAAHEDARRLQQARHSLPTRPGWNDYRAILHAHAEDSSHTGGTRPEMLANAKQAGVHAILLSDHYRPPRDFITESWRGLHGGVLFVPGSEIRGFLIHPTHSILDRMDEPTPAFIETVRADGGLIFLSHIEERPDHAMTGLDGMEIYNRHADAKKDMTSLLALTLKLTDPAGLRDLDENLKRYPDELFAFQVTYPADYLAKWDRETASRRLTGVAANDCHHNMILLVKMVDKNQVLVGTNVDKDDQMRTVSALLRPGIRAMIEGHQPGDILARVDLDPYQRSFRNVSTHVLAPGLDEAAIRAALRDGHAYVSHDWMCDPTGFRFELLSTGEESSPSDDTAPLARMGDEVPLPTHGQLVARFPVSCHARLIRGGQVIADTLGDRFTHEVTAPGVYRLEGWLEVGGEERPWIYANPIYVR